MAEIELFVFLLFAVAVLAGIGLRSGVPYPVALVLGGLVIGLVPGLPSPELDPDVVFFVFLPPLLYAAAIAVSAQELKENWAPISLLAVGLVLVTIAAVAAVANAVLGIPWAAAFVLGAVLGPTDPVSAAAVLDRLGVKGRTKTILEDPCKERQLPDAGGITGAIQNEALQLLDRAACEAGTSREEYALALFDPKRAKQFERDHGVNPRSAGGLLSLLGG